MKTPVGMTFWLRSDKVSEAGTCAVRLRIRVRGRHTDVATNVRVTRADWGGAGRRVLGRTDAARRANSYLLQMQNEVENLVADLDRQGKLVTAQGLARLYRKQPTPTGKTLLELYADFMAERARLVGLEVAHGTIKSNSTAYNRLTDYLKATRQTALLPEEATYTLADKLLYWCLTDKGFKRPTANKIVQRVVQVLRWAVRRGFLEKNPLAEYQFKTSPPGEIKFLTIGELAQLTSADLPPALDRVRDCFVFQCWTGLAYADLSALNLASATYQPDAAGTLRRVLRGTRAKSTLTKGFEYVVPLLPEAERVLAKYADCLPVPTNQAYNRLLKELGQVAGLPADKMTTHVGRKTAGTLLFNLGVPLPVVSKFLGHANTLITQKIYAELLDTTVVDAFAGLFGGPPAPAPRPAPPAALPAPTQVLRPARRIQKGGAGL